MGPVDDSVTTATKSQKRYKVTKSHKVGDDRGDSQRGRVGGRLLAKMLVTKNRSRQRSTPRHPIAMASTAKPPYPMPCALAAVLLPESRAHGCHMQKTLFPGQAAHVCGEIRARPVPAFRIQDSGMFIRGNGVTLRTQKVIQGGDNGLRTGCSRRPPGVACRPPTPHELPPPAHAA